MITFIATITTLLATGLLALSMTKHQRQVFTQGTVAESTSLMLRVGGFGLLAVSIYLLTLEITFGLALTLFFGIFTVTILIVAYALSKL